jgi:exodeoxyribonuclease V gamma subunit
VPFPVIRGWLESVLAGDARHAGFMTGGVTLCAMKPMRAIPFRVIAMLGLDHATFPRRDRRAAFDLIEGSRRPGDRDPRADDRQLFLDTLLCAQDRLILSYVGRNALDNSERADSVVLSELLDQLDREFAPPAGTKGEDDRDPTARHYVQVEHALQPFHPVYYTGEDSRRFSFDPVWQRGMTGDPNVAANTATFTADVEVPVTHDAAHGFEHIALDDLIEAWTEPARFYCRQVLGVNLPGKAEGLEAEEQFTCDPLTSYQLKDALLQTALAQHADGLPHDEDDALAWHAASGTLPIGAGGAVRFRMEADVVRPLIEQLQRLSWRAPTEVVVCGDDWRIEGALEQHCSDGPVIFRPGELRPKYEARGWIYHLVACAALADVTQSRLFSIKNKRVTIECWPALTADEARRHLQGLVAGYREMRARPVAMFPAAAKAWVCASDPADRMGAAQKAFCPEGDHVNSEADDRYVRYLWRGFEDVLTARQEEFARFADRLFGGVPRKDNRSVKGSNAERAE